MARISGLDSQTTYFAVEAAEDVVEVRAPLVARNASGGANKLGRGEDGRATALAGDDLRT